MTCHCGHRREHHQHYRRGTDCALCDCPRYRTHGGRLWRDIAWTFRLAYDLARDIGRPRR